MFDFNRLSPPVEDDGCDERYEEYDMVRILLEGTMREGIFHGLRTDGGPPMMEVQLRAEGGADDLEPEMREVPAAGIRSVWIHDEDDRLWQDVDYCPLAAMQAAREREYAEDSPASPVARASGARRSSTIGSEADDGTGGDVAIAANLAGGEPPTPEVDEEGRPLSAYERQRRRNIRRNEARLRRLGLLGNPALGANDGGGEEAPPAKKKRKKQRMEEKRQRSQPRRKAKTPKDYVGGGPDVESEESDEFHPDEEPEDGDDINLGGKKVPSSSGLSKSAATLSKERRAANLENNAENRAMARAAGLPEGWLAARPYRKKSDWAVKAPDGTPYISIRKACAVAGVAFVRRPAGAARPRANGSGSTRSAPRAAAAGAARPQANGSGSTRRGRRPAGAARPQANGSGSTRNAPRAAAAGAAPPRANGSGSTRSAPRAAAAGAARPQANGSGSTRRGRRPAGAARPQANGSGSTRNAPRAAAAGAAPPRANGSGSTRSAPGASGVNRGHSERGNGGATGGAAPHNVPILGEVVDVPAITLGLSVELQMRPGSSHVFLGDSDWAMIPQGTVIGGRTTSRILFFHTRPAFGVMRYQSDPPTAREYEEDCLRRKNREADEWCAIM